MTTNTEMTPLGELVRAVVRDMVLEQLGGVAPAPARRVRRANGSNGHARGKRKLSAAGRAAIQRAVKARWAKYRKENKGK